MPDLYTKKAKFEQVKWDIKALEFHRDRWVHGSVDPLAKQCWQYLLQMEQQRGANKTT